MMRTREHAIGSVQRSRLLSAAAAIGLMVPLLAGCSGLPGGTAQPAPSASSPGSTANQSTSAAAQASQPGATSQTGPAGQSGSTSPQAGSTATPDGPEPESDNPDPASPSPTPSVTPDKPLKSGVSGPAVADLQRKLHDAGYWVSATNGKYGHTTSQAVMAFQKVAGLSRDGVAGPKTLAALASATRPSARTTSGHVIEIDKKHQVVKIVDDGEVKWVLNTSTGSGQPYQGQDGATRIAGTPSGTFTVSRQISGWHTAPLGQLYSPKFFNGGIALHGSQSIPGYPASHGCARLSVAAMDFIWQSDAMPVGTTVVVY